jgi:hypothetical protein
MPAALEHSSELYQKVRTQLTARFEVENPDQSDRIAGRMWAIEHHWSPRRLPPKVKGTMLEQLVLYSRIVKAQLRELSKDLPDWGLVLQLSLWMEHLERSAAAGRKGPKP